MSDEQKPPSWRETHEHAAKDAGRTIMKWAYIGGAILIGLIIVWKLFTWWLWSHVPDMPSISLPDLPEISLPWSDDTETPVPSNCTGYSVLGFCVGDGE